nr:GNAT family N-acetyltransferase [Bacillus sp. FJAT-45037]
MDIPSLTVHTQRLEIRPYQYHDYQNWYNQYINRLPSQQRYDEGRIDMSVCTEPWFYELVDRHQQAIKSDDFYVFGVFRLEDGAHVGVLDLSTLIRNDFQWGRIGYTIHNQFFNQGYGGESVKALLRLAHTKLNYHRIEAHINLDNHASIALANRVGMEYECIRKGFIHEFGEWTDNHIFYSQPMSS